MNIDIIGNFATRAEAEAHAARFEAYAERKHANPAAGFSIREIDFSIVALNFIEDGKRERIGEYATETQAKIAALYIIDRANALRTGKNGRRANPPAAVTETASRQISAQISQKSQFTATGKTP